MNESQTIKIERLETIKSETTQSTSQSTQSATQSASSATPSNASSDTSSTQPITTTNDDNNTTTTNNNTATNTATNTTTTNTAATNLTTQQLAEYKPLPQTSTTVPLAFTVVQNQSGASDLVLTQLIQLKSIFGRQLPKMPRPYITRLVFDRRHKSLILYLNPSGPPNSITNLLHAPSPAPPGAMVGGICYRAYKDEKFAEIAFCAVQASQQVKGYGSVVMNLLKEQGLREGIEYFITYADNYAVGYFKKLGETLLPRGGLF
jgi:hypothetical protein